MTRSLVLTSLLLLSTSATTFARSTPVRSPASSQTAPGAGGTTATGGKVVLPPGVTVGPSVEGITEYRFPNGLTVLLFPDAGTPETLVNVTYSVGSAREGTGESGMAHLLEHLLFRSSATTPNIGEGFKRHGIDANGSTALDRTNYYGFFQPSDATMNWLLALEADRMRHASVTKADLDAEMTVVRNEMEIGENKPTRRLISELYALAFDWHPYGKNVIGNRSEVEHVPIDRLRAFYDQWYQPDNATVIIAGSLDPGRTLAAVARTLGRVPRPARALPARYTVEPAQDGERLVTIRRAGPDRLLGISYHTPGARDPDFAALRVLDDILGSNPTGRLYQSLVKPGLATNAETALDDFIDPGLFGFYATVPEGVESERLERAMLDQLENLAQHPVTDAEVASAKQRQANYFARANSVNVLGVANGLSDSIASGDWRLWFQGRDAVAGVTTADVNRVARKYLVGVNRTLARFIPTDKAERVEIGEAPSAATLLKDYKGGAVTPAVELFDSSVANIAARTIRRKVGPDLDIALLPKAARGDRFEASMLFRFANEAAARPYRDAADMAANLLSRGTKTMDAEALARRLDELNVRLSIVGGARSVLVGIQSERRNFVPVMQLVADMLRNPAFDQKEFDFVRGQLISAIESGGQEPGEIADRAMRRFFDPYPRGHVEAQRTKEEQLAATRALTLEDVRAFHRDFYGTSRGEIAVVGSFDPEVATREIETLFGGWTSKQVYVREKDPFFAPDHSTRESFETPDKANAVITSQAKFRMTANDPDHAALLVAARVFGGHPKASRLGMRIREREGLSYYVGSGVIVGQEDDNSTFYMQATSAPENMPRVERAMHEELDRFVAKGITPAEFADAKASVLNSLTSSRSTDGQIVGNLRLGMTLEHDPMWDARLEKAVRDVTLDQVNAAIRRHLNPADISYFIAGDFARVARAAAKP